MGISLEGVWETEFSWKTGPYGKEQETSDTISVRQSEGTIAGEAYGGNYSYRFTGSILGEVVVGEWISEQNWLSGAFQLKVDVTNSTVNGFWLGNGLQGIYHGQWRWNRPQGNRQGAPRE